MLLSKRERAPDNTAASSHKPSPISYRRTSIPSISPLLVVSSPTSSNPATARRAPLAPLDPQAAGSMPLDNQSSASSSSTPSSQHPLTSQDLQKDADRALETARSFIGRPIINWPQEEEPSASASSVQSLRKRSLPGQCVSFLISLCTPL